MLTKQDWAACMHTLAAKMWLVPDHRRLDTASGQAPSNRTKDIDKFIRDGQSYDPTVTSDGFLPNNWSDSYATWCGGSHGPSVHEARESSATDPSK